ncbi:Toll-Interleukin-Resistance (TIR) domain family protein [Heracleum sosnowskyi]|uniref:Toll-Interleukin-Resistance (TIR) domain family protein n=1 Tax=Heracleum sosnowskyi TaxID=360622 RepID=A0AAD8HJM2_9APIA|nr:Toll-Interleukin-Resistance (TIR) domain family protein [Heracleum sosnowskyi]
MQYYTSSTCKNICNRILHHSKQLRPIKDRPSSPCDIFISHRGIDTKHNVAGLLYDHLSRLSFRPFMDSKNMKPGDKLFDKIDTAIGNCKIGISVLSPRYCDSYFCLHELSLMMESKKKCIPIFVDVKPSELHVKDNGHCSAENLKRFSWALQEAKYTVGLTFNTSNGNWSEFLMDASDAVMKNLQEMKE